MKFAIDHLLENIQTVVDFIIQWCPSKLKGIMVTSPSFSFSCLLLVVGGGGWWWVVVVVMVVLLLLMMMMMMMMMMMIFVFMFFLPSVDLTPHI
jgi:hypothetical protein